MAHRQFSFANFPSTVFVSTSDKAVRAVPGFAARKVPLNKAQSWSLLRALDKASLAFSRGMTTWATAGRM